VVAAGSLPSTSSPLASKGAEGSSCGSALKLVMQIQPFGRLNASTPGAEGSQASDSPLCSSRRSASAER